MKIYSIEIMGQTLDNYISQIKTNKLKILKQKLASISKTAVNEESSLTPPLIKFDYPLIVPAIAEKDG